MLFSIFIFVSNNLNKYMQCSLVKLFCATSQHHLHDFWFMLRFTLMLIIVHSTVHYLNLIIHGNRTHYVWIKRKNNLFVHISGFSLNKQIKYLLIRVSIAHVLHVTRCTCKCKYIISWRGACIRIAYAWKGRIVCMYV